MVLARSQVGAPSVDGEARRAGDRDEWNDRELRSEGAASEGV